METSALISKLAQFANISSKQISIREIENGLYHITIIIADIKKRQDAYVQLKAQLLDNPQDLRIIHEFPPEMYIRTF